MYFLAIATNIPQWLKTDFVLQGHIWRECEHYCHEPGLIPPIILSCIFIPHTHLVLCCLWLQSARCVLVYTCFPLLWFLRNQSSSCLFFVQLSCSLPDAHPVFLSLLAGHCARFSLLFAACWPSTCGLYSCLVTDPFSWVFSYQFCICQDGQWPADCWS